MKVVKMAKDEQKPQGKQAQLDFSDPEVLLSVLAQINENKQPAIDKLQSEITERLEKLGKLGEDMLLISRAEYIELKNQAPAPAPKKQAAKQASKPEPVGEGYNPDKKCPVCNLVGHDGRKHRTHKDPFTQEELKAMNLLPPEPEQPTLQ